MEFVRRAAGAPSRLGVFPGAFNPPTRAHVALAEAALAHVEEVVFVLPRAFPHKQYADAPLELRIEMLKRALDPRFAIAISEGGLFIEIARELEGELWFICGADAAERIVNWDYGAGSSIEDQLREYGLLVAPRGTVYESPHPRIRGLGVRCGDISASEVRRRIRAGEPWEELVPATIVDIVRATYQMEGRL
jgi:cytidyltransferase-like protein